MPRRIENINSLSRGRIRASMNKFNLFNIYKKDRVSFDRLTLFQQKFKAKQETRGYHGEHLTESRWKSVFNPSLESVAQLDASLKGVGRVQRTPLVLQTYAPLEKRLETALFRSMFASSVRQARQFILGGHVQVNGVVIKHPSFPLHEGDIFNVEPEKVLLAMGRVKPGLEEAIKTDNKQISVWNKYVKTTKENPKQAWELKQAKPDSLDTLIKEQKTNSVKAFNTSIEKGMIEKQKKTTRESILLDILRLAKGEEITVENFKHYGPDAAKCLTIYSTLLKNSHPLITTHNEKAISEFITMKSTERGSAAEEKLASTVKQLLIEVRNARTEHLRKQAQTSKLPEDSKHIPFTTEFVKNLKPHKKLDQAAVIENETAAKVNLPWQKGLFGRKNPALPYFTPWKPRPFIGAFAILPAHIEVSFATCHAIYLRDPIARPGNSEVITPFAEDVHERAYMHYVRKGL